MTILPVESGRAAGAPIVFKATAVTERDPAFSRDGRWIAYQSDDDVYVRPFPGPGATVRISTGGGSNPQWSATSHELPFPGGGKIMSASYTAADTFVPAEPRPWAPQDAMSVVGFVLRPDGKRAAVALVDAEARQAEMYARDNIVFWSEFFDYLKKNVVATK